VSNGRCNNVGYFRRLFYCGIVVLEVTYGNRSRFSTDASDHLPDFLRKGLFKEKSFELRVKLMRGHGKYREVESVAVPSDGGAEACRSCLG